MENEIIPTPQETFIPKDLIKPKKKNILPIIIGIIFVLLIGFIYYQQKQIAKLSEQKPIVSNIPTPEPTPIPTTKPTPTIINSNESSNQDDKLYNAINNLTKELLDTDHPWYQEGISFKIKKQGNLAMTGSGGAAELWKKENDIWQKLIGVNGDWPCKVIFENNVPPEWVDYGCVYSANGQAPYFDFYKYNKVTNKWEKQ